MIAKAKMSYLRIAPRKVQQVIDLIRGKDILSSLATLAYVNKGSAKPISKLLNSAVSNAKLKGLTEEQLVISKITANPGPMWKRFRAASFGRAAPILKRTTHVTIELDLKTTNTRPVTKARPSKPNASKKSSGSPKKIKE